MRLKGKVTGQEIKFFKERIERYVRRQAFYDRAHRIQGIVKAHKIDPITPQLRDKARLRDAVERNRLRWDG